MSFALPHPLARGLAFVARALTVGLLTPVVVLVSLATLAAIAVVGSGRLVRSTLPARRPASDVAAPADFQLYSRAAADGVDAAARRAA